MEEYHFHGSDARDQFTTSALGGPVGIAGAAGSPDGPPDQHSCLKPPIANRGAEITAPSENRSLLDWVAFTVKSNDPLEALKVTSISPALFTEFKYGFSGYKKSLRFENITVYFQGREGMGCHVEMSGKGCRQFETQFSENPWTELFNTVLAASGNFTRLDLALDTVDGGLPLDRICAALQDHEKQIRSHFGEWRRILKGSFQNGEKITGETIYLGSAKSQIMFRIYDKAKESGLDGEWIRFEVQLRDKRAHNAAKLLASGTGAGELASGIINNYFAIINNDDANISRCTLQGWWESWLHSTVKIILSTDKTVKFVADSMQFIKRQYAPSLAMINKHLGAVPFKQFLREVLDDGQLRMGKKHEQILAASAVQGGDKP